MNRYAVPFIFMHLCNYVVIKFPVIIAIIFLRYIQLTIEAELMMNQNIYIRI